MTSDLDNLLFHLEKIPEEVEERASRGFNTLPAPPAVINCWEVYERCLVEFYCHIESSIANVQLREPDMRFDWTRCRQLLRKEWGPNGDKAGFELARTGKEGGVLKVLRTVLRVMIRDATDNQITVLTHIYWHSHSADELLADAGAYIERYSHLLPSEIIEGTGARIREEFLRALKEHPYMMQRILRIGR